MIRWEEPGEKETQKWTPFCQCNVFIAAQHANQTHHGDNSDSRLGYTSQGRCHIKENMQTKIMH